MKYQHLSKRRFALSHCVAHEQNDANISYFQQIVCKQNGI